MYERYKLLIMITCCIFISCNHSDLRVEMEKFLGTKIILPHEKNLETDKIKTQLVIWLDSLDCHTCRLNLLNMTDENPLMQYYGQLNGVFGIWLILSPKKKDVMSLKRIVGSYDFKYHIWIDEDADFLKNNPQLPHDMRLRSFLLDKNGIVILVGDPSFNIELLELYKKTIAGFIEN